MTTGIRDSRQSQNASVGSTRQFILTRKATLLSGEKGGGEASRIIVVFYLRLRAAGPSPASTNSSSWQPCGAHWSSGQGESGGEWAGARLAGRQMGPPRVPGWGKRRETESNGRMLLQHGPSRNDARDRPPGFPLSGSMGSHCYTKEEKFPAIQNTHGNRPAAEPPVPFQWGKRPFRSNGYSGLIGTFFLVFGNVWILTCCFKIAQTSSGRNHLT